jgi:PAS domain S-box-containing protein
MTMRAAPGLQARLSETLRLELVYRLGRELNAEMSSAEVLRRLLHAAAEALGTPHASLVALRNKELQAAYALGGGSDPRPVMERVLANGLAGFVVHNYRTVIVNDIANNPLWMSLPDEPLSPQFGSALCVPLIHSGDVVGVLTLAHPAQNYFTADAVNFTATISEMGAAALSATLLLEESRKAAQRFHSLFDDVIVPIIITNLDGEIKALNKSACEFLGYAPEELLRHNITMIHRPGTGPISGENFDHLKRGLEIRFQSSAWTKADGERLVQVYAKRLSNGLEGDQVQWIEHDLSSQVALEQLQRDLSAMVYHDMRSPLSNVDMSLHALARLLADHPNASVQNLLNIATRSERQVQRMISSLLDVQRLEEGSKLLNRTTSMINMVIRSAIEQAEPLAAEKHVRIRQALVDDLPVLYIDSDMIERVVINLLDNAIKYSPDYGIVTISTSTSGKEVFVRVKDTGPGIPRESQAKIFDKFSRVKQQNMPRGVGLGLAFCKLAVDAHGGRIWIKSDDKNGSTFTVALLVDAPATKELPLLGAAAP